MRKPANLDAATVDGFGEEWGKFTQKNLSTRERQEIFARYFSLVDWSKKPKKALDMGCGSGRWDVLVAPLVEQLIAADASPQALEVAKQNVRAPNVSFIECSPETLPFPDGYFDFIFSLGVLHHVPDTQVAIESLARKLVPGGLLVLYLYYAFDNRPSWYRTLWKLTNVLRRGISKLPFFLRYVLSQLIALFVYWPLARFAKYLPVPEAWPLRFYSDRSFYVMRTDALDRFGTRLEQRFTKEQIAAMLETAGLNCVEFSEAEPHWVCSARGPL